MTSQSTSLPDSLQQLVRQQWSGCSTLLHGPHDHKTGLCTCKALSMSPPCSRMAASMTSRSSLRDAATPLATPASSRALPPCTSVVAPAPAPAALSTRQHTRSSPTGLKSRDATEVARLPLSTSSLTTTRRIRHAAALCRKRSPQPLSER